MRELMDWHYHKDDHKKKPKPHLKWTKATIKWKSPEEGGRSVLPAGTQYSTVARFHLQDKNWHLNAWSLVLKLAVPPNSGKPCRTHVRFLSPFAPKDWLIPGAKFELYEGNKVVAEGEIA